jgi:hypothetical protein
MRHSATSRVWPRIDEVIYSPVAPERCGRTTLFRDNGMLPASLNCSAFACGPGTYAVKAAFTKIDALHGQ